MNSHVWISVSACSLSLAAGYFIGNTQAAKSKLEQSTPAPSRHHTSSSFSERESDALSASHHRSQPKSASGRAKFALHNAKAKLEESSMMMMDFGTFAEVWGMLDGLSGEELRIALISLEEEPAMNQSAMMLRMMLLSQWGEVDGQSAAEYALSQQKGGMRQGMALLGCMSSWIKADPIAAEAWYEKNKSAFQGGMWNNGSINAMFVKGLAKRDLDAAFDKMDLNNTSDRKSAVQTMSQLVTEDDMREQVIAKVQAIGDQQLKHQMLESMMRSLSYQNTEAASELLAQLSDSDPDKLSEYQNSYIGGLTHMDPKAALDYASSEIADDKTRERLLKSSFATYAANDATAAQAWLDSQAFDNNDPFYQRAASNQRWQYPDKAMEWALKIEDDDKRTDEVVEIYERWTEEHEEGAKQWLSQLDEESQTAILEGVEGDDS